MGGGDTEGLHKMYYCGREVGLLVVTVRACGDVMEVRRM
jgi:hypothetical protein